MRADGVLTLGDLMERTAVAKWAGTSAAHTVLDNSRLVIDVIGHDRPAALVTDLNFQAAVEDFRAKGNSNNNTDCGPIEAAANIPIATYSPNFLIQESIERFDGFHAEILKKPIQWQDGYIIPPSEPGLGVELDEAVAAAHPYDGPIFPEMVEEHV